MSSEQRWLPVVGYVGLYEVSDRGNVRSLDRVTRNGRRVRGRVLRPAQSKSGHLKVDLQRDGSRSTRQVHRLVLESFVGPCPDGMQACHFNDVPGDNRLENLRWDSVSANRLDSVRNGGHHFAGRAHCPRGHALAGENLRPSALAGGRRGCLACARARSWLSTFHGYTEQVHQAVADAYYFRVMGWLTSA